MAENYIAGCAHIAQSIQKSKLFASHYIDLLGDESARCAEVGIKPNKMPNLTIKTVGSVGNYENIEPIIRGLDLTWLQINSLSPYGVYHSAIALYGDRHWVTRDQSGALFLHIFNVSFI